MRIENEKIQLVAFDARALTGLTPDQLQMLAILKQAGSIVDVVQGFFAQKKLISFLGLLGLIQLLLSKKITD